MKLLFAFRAAALGGITANLGGRLRFLSSVPRLEVELACEEDQGARELLSKQAPLTIADPWRFREMVAAKRYDVIVALDAAPYLDAIAEISAEQCLVVEVHSTEDLTYLRERKFTCDTFVVPSRYSRRLVQGLVSPYDPIEILPGIVDPRLFHPSPGETNVRPIVGWVGRIDERQDWKRFLLTASVLKEHGAELDFWMVGGETARDAVVEAFLESADALDLSERLRWFPRLEHAAMRRFYSAVAQSNGCLLSTARGESFATSIAEALLTGCPAVAPDDGAMGEIAPGASYLPLYREIEQAAHLVEGFVQSASGARARLAADLPLLRQRFAPETLGPLYLAMLVRLVEKRRNA
jgi:glycosyltransferase involved in cell wall biosynthesis